VRTVIVLVTAASFIRAATRDPDLASAEVGTNGIAVSAVTDPSVLTEAVAIVVSVAKIAAFVKTQDLLVAQAVERVVGADPRAAIVLVRLAEVLMVISHVSKDQLPIAVDFARNEWTENSRRKWPSANLVRVPTNIRKLTAVLAPSRTSLNPIIRLVIRLWLQAPASHH
jgi:hypothetical protein